MNNWFELGEEITLVSKEEPHMNGDYTIIMIVDGGAYKDPHYQWEFAAGETGGLAYILSESKLCCKDEEGDIVSILWCGSALRKKHKGCGEDFQSMMDTLKTPVKESA